MFFRIARTKPILSVLKSQFDARVYPTKALFNLLNHFKSVFYGITASFHYDIFSLVLVELSLAISHIPRNIIIVSDADFPSVIANFLLVYSSFLLAVLKWIPSFQYILNLFIKCSSLYFFFFDQHLNIVVLLCAVHGYS